MTSLRHTERRRYDLATTSCCRVGIFFFEMIERIVVNNTFLVTDDKILTTLIYIYKGLYMVLKEIKISMF